MNKYKDLIIWKKSMELAKVVYTITDKFPSDERYGIVNQMRRAAVSIASNIAEGAGRESNKEFNYFLSVSNGSSYELQTQLIISADINLVNPEKLNKANELIDEIQKMNFALRKSLK
ncbi:MAG: four helix bundle protein [bacterium]|jgi:four helix bundle protein